MRDDQRAIEAAIRDCQQALARLDERINFRTRVAIDMLLAELKKELAMLGRQDDESDTQH